MANLGRLAGIKHHAILSIETDVARLFERKVGPPPADLKVTVNEFVRILHDPTATWMRKDPANTPEMGFTDSFRPVPGCQEIMAKARWWDPYGARWGKGSHWPLFFSIE